MKNNNLSIFLFFAEIFDILTFPLICAQCLLFAIQRLILRKFFRQSANKYKLKNNKERFKCHDDKSRTASVSNNGVPSKKYCTGPSS